MKYVVGTKDINLIVRGCEDDDGQVQLRALADSDLNGHKLHNIEARKHRSRGGYVVFFGPAVIKARSYLQSLTAISSQEAEYLAMLETCFVLMFFVQLLRDLGYDPPTPQMFCDCQPALDMVMAQIPRDSSRHVAMRHSRLRELLWADAARVFKVHTQRNVADMQTKPLPREVFERLRPYLQGQEIVDWTKVHLPMVD